MGMLSPQLHDGGCRSACGVSVNDDNETTTTTTGEESGRRWGELTGRRTRTTCGIGSTRGGGEDASRGYCVAGGTTGRRQQFVSRSVAWDFVRPACEELQALLHRERVALDLSLEDENPLTDEDRSQYAETMRSSVDRFVFLLFCFVFSSFWI